MLTRCPHCQTHFRVTPEQLKARQGQVRCGACQGVFNALDSLADESQLPPHHPLTEVDAAEEPTQATAPPPAEDAAEQAAAPLPTDAPTEAGMEEPATGEGAAPAEAATDATQAPEETAPAEESRRSRDGESAAVEADAEETSTTPAEAPADIVAPPIGVDSLPPPPPRRWPWIVGTLLLLALATLQLLFIFRIELAVVAPELRPALAAGCELIGCALPRPRKPELVGIDASDLAPAGRERLLLTATLRNRAPFDQEYPHLELTLTDTSDAALVRKVLVPADYLPTDRPAQAGFAAGGELALKLDIDAPGVPAVGYRLYLFYP
jgi:predicted Zn finger-like uncharacterized protein